MKVVCWNIGNRRAPWDELAAMDADIALLQEAGPMPESLASEMSTGPMEHWNSHVWNSDYYSDRWDHLYDRWPMVVKLSNRVEVEWFKQVGPISMPAGNEIAVSGIGTIAAARIVPSDAEPFIAVSMYARWLKPHKLARSKWKVGHSDGSAHRIISDLSAFIGHTNPSTHRILAAGDLNSIYGATDNNPLVLADRDRTVFDRMAALGFEFLGPRFPDGRQADPLPQGLQADTRNVPTFAFGGKPTATKNQLDYVFASRGFHLDISVRAMNSPDEWGTSDHCRLWMEISRS